MRICIPIQGLFDLVYGGGQVYVRNLAFGLRDRGHEVTVLEGVWGAHEGQEPVPTSGLSRKEGIGVIRLYLPLRDDPAAQTKVEAAFREALLIAAPDVVHANGLKRLAASGCRNLRIPCLVTAHHGGLVCPAGALLDHHDRICMRPLEQATCTHCCASQLPLAPLWAAMFSFLPSRVQLATGRILRRIPLVPYVTPALGTPLQVHDKNVEVAELISNATFLVAPSNAIREALLRNGANPERTFLIPHGVPLQKKPAFCPRALGQRIRFLYVGRLSRVKGLHVLIQAFNQVRGSAELHIVGRAANKREDRYWMSVVNKVSRPEAFVEHGYLTGDALQEIMAASDVLVLPSICLEAFGLTVAEALAAGKPVITTDSGGPAEQISDGENGMVIEPNNVEALAAAMQRLVDDPQRIDSMARNIRPPRSLADHVDAMVDLYSKCIDRRQAALPGH